MMVHKTDGVARGVPTGEGFTLIEVAIATAIIAIGVVALVVSVGSGTRANQAGTELTQAVFLAQEIREWTLRLPYIDPDVADQSNPPGPDGSDPQVFVDDLDDLLNVTYSPPRDGRGIAIADMPGWSETITLTYRNPDNLSQIVSGRTDVVRVGVEVFHNSRPVFSTGWIVARR
ncbi:MAG TPA: hypothetical protein DCX07_02670, partial [Phycisphaerales bacterium]|nr:hypothetical protein [Phycisphaerales bacterium]